MLEGSVVRDDSGCWRARWCETIRDVARPARRDDSERPLPPTVRYPRAHPGQMKRFGYGVYVPPAPPRQLTLDVNRRSAPVFVIEWNLSSAARGRMVHTSAPHTAAAAIWTCPVCNASIPRLRRAGRHRVYCTNACRQRAYRLRCKSRQLHPMSAHCDPRPARATTRDRVHAIREFSDVSSGRRDSIGRGITACGAFGRMSIDTPSRFGHLRFTSIEGLPNPNRCRRCEQLTGISPSPTGDGGTPWSQRRQQRHGADRARAA